MSGTFFEALIGVTVTVAVILMLLYAMPLLLLPLVALAWVWCAERYQKRKAEHSKPSRLSDPSGFQP